MEESFEQVLAGLAQPKPPDNVLYGLSNLAGAPLAQSKVQQLNLIPIDDQALNELKLTIQEYNDNLAGSGDRVCVGIIGKALEMQSAMVKAAEEETDIKDDLPPQTYYLVNVSESVDCKALLK